MSTLLKKMRDLLGAKKTEPPKAPEVSVDAANDLAYWLQLQEELKKDGRCQDFVSLKAGNRSRFTRSVGGLSGVSYGFYFGSDQMRVEIYIDTGNKNKNEKILAKLMGVRLDVESEIGKTLEWDILEGKRACRISLSREAHKTYKSQWHSYIRWQINTMDAFEKAFDKHFEVVRKSLR